MKDNFLDIFEPIPKKKQYEIRMTVRFDKEITQEEAERRLHKALSLANVRSTCGGIH